jgi:hypothetical protein
MPTMNTAWSWGAVLAIGVVFYYVYTRPTKNSKGARVHTKVPIRQEVPKAPKIKKAKKDGAQSSGDQAEVQKRKNKVSSEESWSAITQAGSSDRDEEEINNREFARQLSSAKAGTQLQAKTQTGNKQKSVKQSRAQEKPATIEIASDANSAAGGDADDDRSSFNSPEFGATAIDAPVTNGGISDMLEEPTPGPAVLRVTAPTNPVQPKKAKAPAATEPVETKKQRQNRKKAELKKMEREADEKERKALLEKQRRTAREAEGRAAKDGSTFTNAQTPSTTVWTAPPKTNGNTEVKPKAIDLLDTSEPSGGKPAQSPAAAGISSEASSDWQQLAAGLSEDEQIRLLNDEDQWETVIDKKKGKKVNHPQQSQPIQIQNKKIDPEDEDGEIKDQKLYEIPLPRKQRGPGSEWEMEVEGKNKNPFVVSQKDTDWEITGPKKQEAPTKETETEETEWEVS